MLHTSRTTRGLSVHPLRAGGAVGWRLLLAFVLLLTLLSTTHSSVRAATDSYVATDVLMLRAEPSTDAQVLAEMVSGEYVAIIDGPTEDGWYFIDYAGIQGWAHGKYLSDEPSAGSGSRESAVGGEGSLAWVDTDVLNVRSDASTDSWILGSVSQGEELRVVGNAANGFHPISYGSDIGWVNGKYLAWSPVGRGAERWILVDRSSSTVNLMVGNEVTGAYWGAMGFDTSEDGFYATALGTYYVYEKNAELTWTDWAKGYIEYWVAFDPDRYNGFHGWTMDKRGNLIEGGEGPTGGCVALDPYFAAVIYEFATYGMKVEVRW